jgi:4-amino-4-deoxy-L-arabinose transferase-like glycosyltransferase
MIKKFIQHKKYLFLFLIIFLGAFLRLYKVPSDPPGLYIDEISIAYNANEIFKKGVDQYGVKDPMWFKAFGEYKMPVYIYLTAGSIAVFGRNDFAVRFPSVVAGILTLLIFYFLVEELAKLTKKNLPFLPQQFAIVATLGLAISPWHIQFSRAGFEATVGLCLYLLGLLCVVFAYKKQKIILLVLSFMSLVGAMYTYDTYRIVAPITILTITGVFLKTQRKLKLGSLFSLLISFIGMLPIILFSLSAAGAERFAQTSAFAAYTNLPVIQKIIHYPIIFLSNYLSYFSLNFLFNIGDGIGRHQMAGFGPMQYWEFPFLMIGLYFFIRNWRSPFYFSTLFLFFLAPFVASVAVPSPHTLRSLLMVIPLTMIVAYGFIWAVKKLLKVKYLPILIIIFALITYEFLFYLHSYYQHYPIINSLDWGAGNEQMVAKAVKYQSDFQHIVVDGKLGVGTIPLYFGFYTGDKLNPLVVSPSWQKPKDWQKGTTLYIHAYYGGIKSNPNIIDTVYFPGQNKDIFAQFQKL